MCSPVRSTCCLQAARNCEQAIYVAPHSNRNIDRLECSGLRDKLRKRYQSTLVLINVSDSWSLKNSSRHNITASYSLLQKCL
jgi:hypothetical protein